jgi:Spirocyclase AveC-like
MNNAVQETTPQSTTPQRRTPWPWQYFAAAVGAMFLFWESWTIIAWLADGPQPVTRYRDTDSANWYAAKSYEAGAILLALVVGTVVVRGCLRRRRLTFGWSSNFVNLANWCGHAPFIINPDCGRLPEPVLFGGLLYTFGFLGVAMAVGAVLRRLQRHRPDLSLSQLVGVTFGLCAVMAVVVELLPINLHLWGYPWVAGPALFGYPLLAALGAAQFFTLFSILRHRIDDHGRTVLERGLSHVPTRSRSTITTLALIGVFQLDFVVLTLCIAIGAPYVDHTRYDPPAYLVNGMCDTAGSTHTAYGPCPGSNHFTMPIRTLPHP